MKAKPTGSSHARFPQNSQVRLNTTQERTIVRSNLVIKVKLLPTQDHVQVLNNLTEDYREISKVLMRECHDRIIANNPTYRKKQNAIPQEIYEKFEGEYRRRRKIQIFFAALADIWTASKIFIGQRRRDKDAKFLPNPHNINFSLHYSARFQGLNVVIDSDPNAKQKLALLFFGCKVPIMHAKMHEDILISAYKRQTEKKDEGWRVERIAFIEREGNWYAAITVAKEIRMLPAADYPAVAILTNRNTKLHYSAAVLLVTANKEVYSFYISNKNYKHIRRLYKEKAIPELRANRLKSWHNHTISKNIIDWILELSDGCVPKIVIGVDANSDKTLINKLRYKLSLKKIPTTIRPVGRIVERIICPRCIQKQHTNRKLVRQLKLHMDPNFMTCTTCFFRCWRYWMILRQIAPCSIRRIKRGKYSSELQKIEQNLQRRLSAVKQRIRQ